MLTASMVMYHCMTKLSTVPYVYTVRAWADSQAIVGVTLEAVSVRLLRI